MRCFYQHSRLTMHDHKNDLVQLHTPIIATLAIILNNTVSRKKQQLQFNFQ